ncbi:nucleoside triphosphate pyrophosphohydrolase family protein [Bacillus paranthracis]|uniref:nucleoside triphosphate pyrophosphohydrolase family protein n=1 Tax=Bacillus paranthracis TaxID=2026186 RepID=UPI00399C53A9
MTNKKDLKIGFSWEPKKEVKPIGKVIRFKSNVKEGKLLTGYCVGVDDVGYYVVYYSGTSIGDPIKVLKERIVEAYEVVKHEPKKVVATKPYEQLVAYYSDHRSKTIWGVFTGMDGDIVRAHWNGSFYYDPNGFMPLDRIIAVKDIIIHEPKEQTLSAAQELSVQQESANFAHVAVQGIINAHAEKNNTKEVNVQVMLPRFYSHEEFKAYGEEQYMRGREDEHRENPQGLKTVEEYKKYGRDCYLQGQEDTEKRMISQNTLELAKEKAYSEGLNDAKRVAFTFDDFDLSVRRTWKKQDFKDAVSNAALGLTGEAGEVADLIKKAIYHGRGFQPSGCDLPDNGEIDPDDVKDELSDVLFYVSAMAQEFGFTLEDVAKHNREKLEKRFPEGFSIEDSAQKKDKHGRKFPFKAKVVGDRDGNPTGMRHGLNYGRIVTVTGEIFGNCYKADGFTIHLQGKHLRR